MRVTILVAAAALSGGAAAAQTALPDATRTGRTNAAINPTGNAASSVNASGTVELVPMSELASGANSFTEAQARHRIEGAGFTDVTHLEQDAAGIWRGRATRDGRTVAIGFDYEGRIAAR